MNTYEMMCIFDTKANAPGETTDLLESVLKSHNVTIEKKSDMGTKRLAYLINKKREGHYWLYDLKADASSISGMEKEIMLNEKMIRHMVIRRDN